MKYDQNGALLSTHIPELSDPKRGKVRDIYEVEDQLLLIATDRISAFDCVMPNGIPDKGRVLTSLSKFWFNHFDWMSNHLITADVNEFPEVLRAYSRDLAGRSMVVKKVVPYPVECVCRGYLIGSGWKDYQKTGTVCGIPLKAGYQLAARLDAPIFTPSSKAEQGEHDENISYAEVVDTVGADVAAELRKNTLDLYSQAAEIALKAGIIIADTKFEFGREPVNEEVILIDEVLTPDSSRFWPSEQYELGKSPPSLDKQYVRDYLEAKNWNKEPPAPTLPDEVVEHTREKYLRAYKELTGRSL